MKNLCCIVLSFLFLTSFAQSDEDEILRLKKGEYYFYYLMGDYPSAINQLAQWRKDDVQTPLISRSNKANHLSEEADMMEATILLSLGLYEQAEDIYLKIKESDRTVSSSTWFYLAQRWFEIENYEAVLYSIDNIDAAEVDLEVISESQFMRATSYLELGMYKEAQQQIESMPRTSIWAGYARHNYLLAMFYGNSSGKSLPLLVSESVFYLPESKEAIRLKDRIYLMSAIHFLQENNPQTAAKLLRKISLDGPFTSVALLHYGWALLEQGRYESALQPWRELQTRYDETNPDVMESMVGVPQILELMNANTQSLKAFESVETKLLKLKSTVTDVQSGIDSNIWLETWINEQHNKEWGYQSNVDEILTYDSQSKILKELIIDQSFINKMAEYRDFVLLTDSLNEKEHDLLQWRVLAQQRERESKILEANSLITETENKLSVAKAGLLNLQEYLDQSNDDLFSLTNSEQASRFTTLVESSKVITRLIKDNKASRDIEQYKKRWMRVKGVFIWNMNEDKPYKQWALKKELLATEKAIKKTELQLSETLFAKQRSPEAWVGMIDRIDNLLAKVIKTKQFALGAKATSKDALLIITKDYLNDLIYRVNDYLAKTRISIARLYDDALQKNISEGAFSGREQ